MKTFKKLALTLGIALASVGLTANSVLATTIEITFGAGPFCWLPGICKIVISDNVQQAHYHDGIMSFVVPASSIDPKSQQFFNGPTFDVGADYQFGPAEIQALGLPQNAYLPVGQYPMVFNGTDYMFEIPVQY